MDDFFTKVQRLSKEQSKEIAALCCFVALLLLIAAFFMGLQ
jgi:hypothetical protein